MYWLYSLDIFSGPLKRQCTLCIDNLHSFIDVIYSIILVEAANHHFLANTTFATPEAFPANSRAAIKSYLDLTGRIEQDVIRINIYFMLMQLGMHCNRVGGGGYNGYMYTIQLVVPCFAVSLDVRVHFRIFSECMPTGEFYVCSMCCFMLNKIYTYTVGFMRIMGWGMSMLLGQMA